MPITANAETYKILTEMVERLGFSTSVALILIIGLMGMSVFLLRHVVQGYQHSIRTLNDQNKKYQDYFLNNRTSSGKMFLGEKELADNNNGRDTK